MGVDINVKIAKYNPKTNFYHDLSLFRLREPNEKVNDDNNYDPEKPCRQHYLYKRIPPYNGRNGEMFDMMSENEDFPCVCQKDFVPLL